MEGIYAFADQIKIYKAILDSTNEIQKFLRYHSVQASNTTNEFGENVSNVDLEANKIILKHLRASGVCYGAASEETETEVMNERAEYFVTFDAIQGQTVVDCNFSVASIYGIWQQQDLEGKTGRELVGAAIAVYGTRTTIAMYNVQSKAVEELTLMKIGK